MADAVFRSRDCWTKYGTPKLCWRSPAAAKRAARLVGGGCKAYECPHCGSWHIGHPPERN